MAIILAAKSSKFDILGITTVNGNRGIEFTTENTLRVVDLLGGKIPVFKGCGLPLTATLIKGRKDNVPFTGQEDESENVHQDYLNLPESVSKVQDVNAVSWIVSTLMNSSEPVTLVPVGPLTNIASALRIEPRIKDKIDEIVIMGGGYRETNVVPGVEFNFWVDPDAAKIVLDSGCNITLVPLDATHAAAVSNSVIADLKSAKTSVADYAAEIVSTRLDGYNRWQPMQDTTTVPIHDALAVAYMINPEVLVQVIDCYVDIDVSGGICDGQSVCDVERKMKKAKPNCRLALSGNSELFGEVLVKNITN